MSDEKVVVIEENLKQTYILRAEVAEHNKPEDMWIIINNHVYDLTKFQKRHPGGKAVLNEVAGNDGTVNWILAGHSPKAQEQMKEYLIAEVDPNEKTISENPMHKGDFSKIFPYLSATFFFIFLYFCVINTDFHLENKSDIWGLIFGIGPSLFLIIAGFKLWPGRHFRTHRIGGLLFLFQYALSWYFYFTDYQWYKNSFLVWSLVLNGCLQATSAIIQIGPTLEKTDKGEYFGNKHATVSLDFVTENLFYQILTTFSTLYYYPQFYNALRSNLFGKAIEIIFVFLPYLVIRPFFPKTKLRDAINQDSTVSTTDHRFFFILSNWAIKIFVLGGKHYIGLMTNTVRYLGGLSSLEDEKLLHFLMLANAGTVTISTFLHTLKFKNQLSPKVSMSVYLMFLYTPLIAIIQLVPRCYPYWKMFIIFTLGLFINFTDKVFIQSWTLVVTAWFVSYQNGLIPEAKDLIF